jgi:hypothetical protein
MTVVQVDELCTRTVKRTPIIKPTMGFVKTSFPENISPADLPAIRRKASVKNVREHMKTYRSTRRLIKRANPMIHSLTTFLGLLFSIDFLYAVPYEHHLMNPKQGSQ